MAWDFETDPEFEMKLAWMRAFVREQIMPLETLADRWRSPQGRAKFAEITAPMKKRSDCTSIGLTTALTVNQPPECISCRRPAGSSGVTRSWTGSVAKASDRKAAQASRRANSSAATSAARWVVNCATTSGAAKLATPSIMRNRLMPRKR